jgi:hypothetical protein
MVWSRSEENYQIYAIETTIWKELCCINQKILEGAEKGRYMNSANYRSCKVQIRPD